MSKNTTTEHIIANYTEFQELIKYVTTYTGAETISAGAVLDPSKDLKQAMFIQGHAAKKLRATDQVKSGGTVYKYQTKQDKLRGTVTRYAKTVDLVDKDVLKQYQVLLKDLNTKLIRGDINAADYAIAVTDLAKTQANA